MKPGSGRNDHQRAFRGSRFRLYPPGGGVSVTSTTSGVVAALPTAGSVGTRTSFESAIRTVTRYRPAGAPGRPSVPTVYVPSGAIDPRGLGPRASPSAGVKTTSP